MSKVKKTVYVMYTEEFFFYYQELGQVEIWDNTLVIRYRDPYGEDRILTKIFGFWERKKVKALYDEVIKVNNLNKEKERKYVNG